MATSKVSDPAERRQHRRVEREMPIGMRLGPNENPIKGKTCNISPAGVYCEVDRAVPEMTQLMIMLEFPDEKVACEGTVVRSSSDPDRTDRHRLAIFFHQVSEDAKRALAQLS